MPVNTPRKDYLAAARKWQRLRDCYEGRDAVLAAGTLYVPDLPGADRKANDAYRNRGNFYNAVQRTVQGMVGMLFQKEMVVQFPKRLDILLKDVTLTSVNMEMFAFTATSETLLIGRYGILVDIVNTNDGAFSRPYLAGYFAEDIISWSVDKFGGDGTLSQVILREIYEEEDEKDPFIYHSCEQYRVLSLAGGFYSQQLWRKSEDEWMPYEAPIVPLRRGLALDFIPFTFLGPQHVTPDLVKSPLLDLADVNLGHWRNSVDYEHGLHLVALPTPWVSGMKARSPDPNNQDGELGIGPAVVWELDVNGSAGMLEYTGAGMKSLEAAMEDKKKQMASLGARLLDQEPRVQETATAAALRHSGDHATMSALAIAMGQGLTMVLQIAAWWMSTEAKPDALPVSIELNKEYLNIRISAQDVQAATASVQAGKMSFETYWHILQSGGWGRDGVSAEDELKQIDIEEPPLPKVDPLSIMPEDTAQGDGMPPVGKPAPMMEDM